MNSFWRQNLQDDQQAPPVSYAVSLFHTVQGASQTRDREMRVNKIGCPYHWCRVHSFDVGLVVVICN